ncbi:LOW QUALITY PROTEIN: antigen peptide transporter 2 [Pterocles gutturalis]
MAQPRHPWPWRCPRRRLACLALVDLVVVLAVLARLAPALAQLGPVATWLEAGLRLPAFTAAVRLLAPGGPRSRRHRAQPQPATFLTLRSLLVPYDATPALLATAAPAWLALAHGTTAAALLAWAVPEPGEAVGTKSPAALRQLLVLTWTEWPVLCGAFFFLGWPCWVRLGDAGGSQCATPHIDPPPLLVPAQVRPRAVLHGKALDAVWHGDGPTTFTCLVLAADLGSSLFAGCRGGLFMLAQARLKLSIRYRLFSLVRQDLAFFRDPAAELSAWLANDVLLCRAVPTSANVALRSLVTVLGLGGFMVGLSPQLALLAPEVPLTITGKVYDARYQVLQRALLDATANTAAVVQEAVSSIETVRTFAGEEEEARHSQAVAKMLGLKDQMDVERALFTVQRVLQVAVQVLVLCYGHQQLREGTITTGSLVILYQAKVGRHVQVRLRLVFGHGDLLSKVAGTKVLEYLDQEPSRDTGGTQAPTTLRGHIAFQHVSFAYPARPEHVLQDVSFELRPGEVTALVGLNGSGKSTCAALLERFYEPGAGEVLLDGMPLRDYEHHYLHRQVALVGQEPVLFSGTDNITFGLEDCGGGGGEGAAAAAGALGFISALDRGFDTDVGEKGGQLWGEKQRIAIARLVRQPTVLILDEATSALDGEGEVALQQCVRSRGVQTVLLITHSQRMLEAADHIVVLERGTVVETGTPAELRSRHGPYSHLLQRSSGTGQPEDPGMGCGEGAAPVKM